MAVETAADRAAMFDEGEFGTAAVYAPPAGSPETACTIIFEAGREQPFEVGAGTDTGLRGAIAWHGALLRVDEVVEVETGGTIRPGAIVDGEFVAGPDTYEIVGRPNLDETGQIWTVDLEEAA